MAYNEMQQIAKHWCWKWEVLPHLLEIVLSGLFLYWASFKTSIKATLSKFLSLRENNLTGTLNISVLHWLILEFTFHFASTSNSSNQIAWSNHRIQLEEAYHQATLNLVISRLRFPFIYSVWVKGPEVGNYNFP